MDNIGILLSTILDSIRGNVTHVLAILVCIIAYLKQVKVLESPRFLMNIVYCWVLMGVMYLAKIFLNIFEFHIVNGLINSSSISNLAFGEAKYTMTHIDIILSFSSSYFLIKAGKLISIYHFIGLPKRWSAKYLTILYSLIMFTLLSMEVRNKELLIAISILDVLISFYAASALARKFYNPSPELRRDTYSGVRKFSRYFTTISLYVWGILQIPCIMFILLDNNILPQDTMFHFISVNLEHVYFTTLMFLKFIIAINIVVYCVFFVPDKAIYREFKNGETGQTDSIMP